MKTCTKCGVEKLETEFHKRAVSLGGFASKCKACVSQWQKEDRAKNPTVHLARVKVWAKNNREKSREFHKRWRDKNHEQAKAASRNWARKNKERMRGTMLLRKYGLTLLAWETMFKAQNGVCAICGKPDKLGTHLSVDHIHGTNPPFIRGLLCRDCNTTLGKFEDSPLFFRKAAEYLERFSIKTVELTK